MTSNSSSVGVMTSQFGDFSFDNEQSSATSEVAVGIKHSREIAMKYMNIVEKCFNSNNNIVQLIDEYCGYHFNERLLLLDTNAMFTNAMFQAKDMPPMTVPEQCEISGKNLREVAELHLGAPLARSYFIAMILFSKLENRKQVTICDAESTYDKYPASTVTDSNIYRIHYFVTRGSSIFKHLFTWEAGTHTVKGYNLINKFILTNSIEKSEEIEKAREYFAYGNAIDEKRKITVLELILDADPNDKRARAALDTIRPKE